MKTHDTPETARGLSLVVAKSAKLQKYFFALCYLDSFLFVCIKALWEFNHRTLITRTKMWTWQTDIFPPNCILACF